MIGDQLAGLVGGAFGDGLYETIRRRKLARADAEGRPLEFPGSILGSAGYCHPDGGFLRVDGTTLAWLTGKGGISFPVPTAQLTVRELAPVDGSKWSSGDSRVTVVCDDAGTAVRIVVLEADLRYLARALPGIEPLLEENGRG